MKTSVVANWPRIAAKHLDFVIEEVKRGTYDFAGLERLLDSERGRSDVDELDGSDD